MPEPQIPTGAASPMVFHVVSRVCGSIQTCSMAPVTAGVPEVAPAPSNAGPAEHAQVTSQSELPNTISPLVPTSMNRVTSLCSYMPVRSSPAVMSAPTYAPTQGRQSTSPSGCMRRPSDAAGTGGRRPAAGIYGSIRMWSGCRPRNRWIMVVLPATVASEIRSGARFCRPSISSTRVLMVETTRSCSSTRRSGCLA